MIARTIASAGRGFALEVRLICLLGALLVITPGGAGAITMEFESPSQVTVDTLSGNFLGEYATIAPHFEFVVDYDDGTVLFLTLKDFYIPTPIAAFAEYEFLIEDPENPNSYAPMQDIPVTWDTMFDTGGEIVGRIQGEVRTRLTLTLQGGIPQTSDFVLTLTTDPTQTGPIFCPIGNSNPGRTGSDLPKGYEAADGAFLTLVAGACADINAPTNDLPHTIVALTIPGVISLVPEPAARLQSAASLVVLAFLAHFRRG